MKSMKINQLERCAISDNEMRNIHGGQTCGCSCYYRNVGGSSINANGSANWAGSKNSPIKTADAALMVPDGKGGCYDFWRTGKPFVSQNAEPDFIFVDLGVSNEVSKVSLL